MRVIYLSVIVASMMVSQISFADDSRTKESTDPVCGNAQPLGDTSRPCGGPVWGVANPCPISSGGVQPNGTNAGIVPEWSKEKDPASFAHMDGGPSSMHCEPAGAEGFVPKLGDNNQCPPGMILQANTPTSGGRMGSVVQPTTTKPAAGTVSLDYDHGTSRNPASFGQKIIIGGEDDHH